MKTRLCLIILSLIILLPWTACSNGGDPSTPSDLTPDIGLEAPEITPPRDSADGPDVPDGAEVEIELDPSGEPTVRAVHIRRNADGGTRGQDQR